MPSTSELVILRTIKASLNVHHRQLSAQLWQLNADTDREQYHLYRGIRQDVTAAKVWIVKRIEQKLTEQAK